MGLFSRIKSICQAKAEKAVTAMENQDPAALAQQKLNRAQEEVNDYRKAVQKLGAEQKRLEAELATYKTDAKKWGKNAETALQAENEDLARQALERQTTAEQNAASTQTSLKNVTAQFENAKDNLLKNQKLIRDQQAQMATLKARQEAAQANKAMREATSKFSGCGGAMSEIDRFKQMVDSQDAEAEAAEEIEQELTGGNVDAQFAEMEKARGVEDKLAAMKAKKGQKA